MIRRLKEEVMGSLPDKIRSQVQVRVDEKMQAKIRDLR
jgi:hypothetical protein